MWQKGVNGLNPVCPSPPIFLGWLGEGWADDLIFAYFAFPPLILRNVYWPLDYRPALQKRGIITIILILWPLLTISEPFIVWQCVLSPPPLLHLTKNSTDWESNISPNCFLPTNHSTSHIEVLLYVYSVGKQHLLTERERERKRDGKKKRKKPLGQTEILLLDEICGFSFCVSQAVKYVHPPSSSLFFCPPPPLSVFLFYGKVSHAVFSDGFPNDAVFFFS